MKNILIIKVGALGDVIRTTAILNKFKSDNVTWFTSEKAKPLLYNNPYIGKIITELSVDEVYKFKYDLVLNMDEEKLCCEIVSNLMQKKLAKESYGFYMKGNSVNYNGVDTSWLDISLSGKFTREKSSDLRWKNKADELKWLNRRSYENHMFSILGFKFNGEEYVLNCNASAIKGLVGIQNPLYRDTKWPMKRWNNYEKLADGIKKLGYNIRLFGIRENIQDHIKDIAECEYVICEDSLPMQISIALKKPTIALFICTSPYEIYGYGRVTKLVSTKLKEYFYRRDFDSDAANTIPLSLVLDNFKNMVQK